MTKTKRPVAQFPKAHSVGPREWGEETLLVLASGKYTMKKLEIKAGKYGGLQYHRQKDEASYIVSGRMILRYENEEGKLIEREVGPGDWFHFPNGCIHQEIALTDVVRIEVSTPHFNDRVRVEDMFGIPNASGLPTTEESEIEIR
jgi:mannose-6-phosphate isomerase-like protein (cupin superfamily)